MKIILNWEITYHNTRIFFSMFIPMPSLRFTVQLNGEVSASKVPFILCLKPTGTKRT